MHTCNFGHRHSAFFILPPHMLREIARNGNAAERNAALNTLAVDSTLRTQRLTLQLSSAATGPAVIGAGAQPPQPHRIIYTAGSRQTIPGTLVRAEGQPPSSDDTVNEVYSALGAVFDFYLEVYQRNSIDNHGLPLIATVDYGHNYQNAFWTGQQMVFGSGDGHIFNRFTASIDVIGHEPTHGVIGSNINHVYFPEAGALNESLSDVFGSLIKQYALRQTTFEADWQIGAGLLTVSHQALRSLKAPGTAYDDRLLGKDPQPADRMHYVHTAEDSGVYINSGIPNRAFYLVATALGGNAWEKAGQI
jgi:Zn-dependent metalloprotease